MSDASNRVTFFVEGYPAPAGSKSAFPRVVDPNPPAGLVEKMLQARERGQIREALRLWVSKTKLMVQLRDSSKYQKPWQTRVAQVARRVCPAVLFPKGTPVSALMIFSLERPKSHYMVNDRGRALRPAFRDARPVVLPDALKLARAVEDALTGVCYDDDAQIVEELIQKVYGSPVGVMVTLTEAIPLTNGGSGDE